MSQIEKTREHLEKQASGFLQGKPIWIWWISYTVLVGILFGLFYFIWTLLTQTWWIITIIIIVIGIAWSTITYFNQEQPSSTLPADE